jgi:hypothetical protein
MKNLGQYPYGCELDHLRSSAIDTCDGDDGLVDGIILDPNTCKFDPFALVGNTFHCNETGTDIQISSAAATVFRAYSEGPRYPNGEFLWYGPNVGANLTETLFGTPGLAATDCSGGTCVGLPFPFGLWWVGLFLEKVPDFNFSSMTDEDFVRYFHQGIQEYTSIIGTTYSDLSEFRDSGGKMISTHGLVSSQITSWK